MRLNDNKPGGGELDMQRNEPGRAEGRHGGLRSGRGGFSLIELLIVIGIIGLLASIGLPALRGLTGGTGMESANRQLIDDLSYARMRAIADRTTVYVVFVTPSVITDRAFVNGLDQEERKELQKLVNGQYSSYALFANRSLGDQPGPGTRRYLTEWRTLPEGVFITTNTFDTSINGSVWKTLPATNRPLPNIAVAFPLARSKPVDMPCVAFDYQGRLLFPGDQQIRLAKGDVIVPMESDNKTYKLEAPEVVQTPRDNTTNNPGVRIDWLTGRARAELPQIL